jgi:secreted trypsin-like serine protease
MKKLFNLTLVVLSINASAADIGAFTQIVGRPIVSPMKDQVCHLALGYATATCSGVRLSTDYVLTAQHCARDLKGKGNSISVECNGDFLKVESVAESKEFVKIVGAPGFNDSSPLPSQFDFALIKLKNPKPFTPKFKLPKNFSEYQGLFLNSSESTTYNYAEKTYCEFHGYGLDKNSILDKYNSTFIDTIINFEGNEYFINAIAIGNGGVIKSPFLPEIDYKDKNWVYSTARPGDSGGPLFCKSKTGEMILSGIASTLEFKTCEDQFQSPKKGIFKPAPIKCHHNTWGMPSKEVIESIFGVQID